MKGKRTRNHETDLYPCLQITSRAHVQNNTYNILAMNTVAVFGTLHENSPTQYLVVLPMFCASKIIIEMAERTKYMKAGVHNFLNLSSIL